MAYMMPTRADTETQNQIDYQMLYQQMVKDMKRNASAGGGVNTTPPFDWGKLGTGLMAGASLFGGQGPQLTGYDWLNYQGPGGIPQLSPWANDAYSNWQNLMARQGMAGGYDPAATYKIFASQVMPTLSQASREASKGYQQLLVDQARKMMAPAMETAYANLAGGSGEYSGYGMQQMRAASEQLADQYSRAGAEAELALLNSWSGAAVQQLPAHYQQMYQMFSEPYFVAPTAVPQIAQGEQSWFQKMLQGGLTGAGIGASFGGVGALIGGGIGLLGGLLT